MKTSELTRLLTKGGCKLTVHGTRHDEWYSPITGQTFPVGRHDSEEAKTGTLSDIAKQSGVSF